MQPSWIPSAFWGEHPAGHLQGGQVLVTKNGEILNNLGEPPAAAIATKGFPYETELHD